MKLGSQKTTFQNCFFSQEDSSEIFVHLLGKPMDRANKMDTPNQINVINQVTRLPFPYKNELVKNTQPT